jgi:S1-C subfamily serine protease
MISRHPIANLRRSLVLRQSYYDGCHWQLATSGRRGSHWRTSRQWHPFFSCTHQFMVGRALGAFFLALTTISASAEPSPDLVFKAQSRRIEMIERIAPSVVAVFDTKRTGGGSGVIIDPEGYGLTNYHVVAGMLNTRRGLGGLNDGEMYELEVLGIDPTGDVAMFRLIGRDRFPFATLGDSDRVRVGDTAIAMGNPFSLSDDNSPTVTMGIVTGIHRYQMGVRGNLTYSDCIQTDAPINPGNSGGPLFNAAGEVIGINGRISVNTRGRFNVGFAYAISSNQIRRFIPALRAGLLARHGSLQATVDDRQGNVPSFAHIMPNASAEHAGVLHGDGLLRFDSVAITSPNHFASILGTYPAGWHVPIELQRNADRIARIARLDPIEPEMRAPFEVDREVNLRQVKRVLQAHKEAITSANTSKHQDVGTSDTQDSVGWECTLKRERTVYRNSKHVAAQHADGDKTTQRYRVTHDGVGPIRMHQIHEDDSPGPEIVFDDKTVTRLPNGRNDKTSEGNRTMTELRPEDRLILAAMYLVQERLLTSIDDIDLANVTHAGGNAFVQPEQPSKMVEVIDWPIMADSVASLWFDARTFDLLRVEVSAQEQRDRTLATINLSDYQKLGGVRRPCTFDVSCENEIHRDRLTDWKIEP